VVTVGQYRPARRGGSDMVDSRAIEQGRVAE
jgi:hypothetical protein